MEKNHIADNPLVRLPEGVTAEFFKTLGCDTRLRIFFLLCRAGHKGMCVEDVVDAMDMKKAVISAQLKELNREGFCTRTKEGKRARYRASSSDVSEKFEKLAILLRGAGLL